MLARIFLCPETTMLDLARIQDITRHKESFGREALAVQLAFKSEIDEDEAIALLAVAPRGLAPVADLVTASGQAAGLEHGTYSVFDLWGALGHA